jgi:uncharacterized protein (UPF0297 family)
MNTSTRFDLAIRKLYKAFHDNKLNPLSCTQCAVGNILDNKDYWKNFSNHNGSLQLNYVGLVHQSLDRKFNGFTPSEILKIEAAFLAGCGYYLPLNQNTRQLKRKLNHDDLFNGLVAVVGKLCQLDNIPHVMDCSVLFDYSKTELSLTKQENDYISC